MPEMWPLRSICGHMRGQFLHEVDYVFSADDAPKGERELVQ